MPIIINNIKKIDIKMSDGIDRAKYDAKDKDMIS